MARLEHVNFTASDPDALADLMCRLFGWQVRWSGAALGGGRTVHVGGEDAYLAIYRPADETHAAGDSYHARGGLNHIGIVVDDLAATEKKVKAEGFTPHSHADYEPGQRFYFDGPDGVEFEVVAYN